jgi:L-ascorbate metabolism protein UlaG (beta-lactamase superfamily)
MIIRPIGQSGYVVRSGDCEIIIDPYLSDSVNRVSGRPRMLPVPIVPENIRCAAVICTHDHLDHLDVDTVARIDPCQHFITTSEGKEKLHSLGRDNVTVLCVGESICLGELEVTAVFADHTVEAIGVIVRGEGRVLYFSGDTLYNERLFGIAKYTPDFTFICINGRLGNMNAEQALVTAKKIGAPINVPTHYDMFLSNSADPHSFADNIDGGFIMEFNREYELSHGGEALTLVAL